MSSRRAKARRSGHPARVAAATRQSTPKKGRPPQNGRARKPPRPRPPRRQRNWGPAVRNWVGGRITLLLRGRQRSERRLAPLLDRRTAPLLELDRTDVAWALATAAGSAGLFATVLTSHPGLGDSAEAVAGVSSLGILHAPGYPTYVVVAHLFTLLIPFGNEAFKVNLFSLVCGSLSVGGVQLLARRCGAARWAAAIGALLLATTAGFWFYSGYAKHDLFSGLLFLASLHVALSCQANPSRRNLIALAVLIGLGLGSSWPLEILLLPTVGFILFVARRRIAWMSLFSATAAGLLTVVAIYGFVMVRAGENPALNWGGATTVHRLVNLIDRADFTPHDQTVQAGSGNVSGAGGASSASPSGRSSTGSGGLPAGTVTLSGRTRTSIESYLVIFAKELGVLGILLALGGLLASLFRKRTAASFPLLIAFAVNLVGAAMVVGPGTNHGYNIDIAENGFLLGSYFVLGCWAAIGATELVGVVGSPRLVGRFRGVAARMRVPSVNKWVVAIAAAAIAAVALVPPAISHWNVAHRNSKPYADAYASSVFSELPPHSALFILGQELTDPLIYRQVVDHQRRDVVVIAADGLSTGWYRQQVSRSLGRALPALTGYSITDAARTIRSLLGTRPVYLDPQTAAYLQGQVGYQPVGLLNVATPGKSWSDPVPPVAIEQRVLAAERSAGLPNPNWHVWPNDWLERATYSTAELEVARSYYDHHDLAGMRRALLNVVSIEPTNSSALRDLSLLRFK